MNTVSKSVGVFIGAIAFVLPLAAGAAPFNPEVLNSVVSLLPDWAPETSSSDSRRTPPEDPEGSAVAIFPGGYFATNAHVLRDAKKARIRLADGRLLEAEIIGRDGATDLALIKANIDAPVLKMAPEPLLGSPVCAVGNQFGLGLSVSCGVVSATRRTGTGFNPIEDFIQTDAAVNPGGSGGALVDAQGHLVGLVSAIFTKNNDSNIGVNFATSSALLHRILIDLRDFGKVVRVESGLRVRALSQEKRRHYSGARVIKVIKNSAALSGGILMEDILTRVAGRPIHKPSDVSVAFQLQRPGDLIEVQFLRDGHLMKTKLHP